MYFKQLNMNTPAHLALSVFIWREESRWIAVTAICIGALLPDLPMIGFYLYQKFWLATPEHVIWSMRYFEDHWQLFFDYFNSVPIYASLLVLCIAFKSRFAYLLCASALIHLFFDFPLHHDDAHRHFLPFSDWRFSSPISYWDPRHFGDVFLKLEMLLTVLGSGYVILRSPAKPMRVVAIITLIAYLLFSLFAHRYWN